MGADRYIFDAAVLADEYHVEVVKEKLTRKLPDLLPYVIDEVRVATKDHIVTKEDGRRIRYPLAAHILTASGWCRRVD